ncbi:MAG: recombinase family protein [Synergistaceae bacterium]|nr:recombinase family protein [Synergistaceae bacterium]
MEKRKFGYARVSQGHQDEALQLNALKAAGIGRGNIFVDKLSGKLSQVKRPQLSACLQILRTGDTLFIWKLDRLGRSVKDLINIVQELEERSILLNSLTEVIDTSSPAGRLFFHIMAAFGEFERNLIIERSMAGLAAAKECGRIGGRRHKLSPSQQENLIMLYKAHTPIKRLQGMFGISKSCLYDYLHFYNIISKTPQNK